MYLLDANVLIFAKRDYYPLERIPEYWAWLLHQAKQGAVKMPAHIWDELQGHDDELRSWVRTHKNDLVLKDDEGLDQHVPTILQCYCGDLTESELEQIGADPFLIAAAMAKEGVVVSKENSQPAKQRANRRVPDICKELGVRCINDHQLIRELDFSTAWRRKAAR